MITERVKANALSCLLNEDPLLEPLPEPFRMQGGVSFVVPYSEYREYILSLRDEDNVQLMTNLAILRGLASQSSPHLFKYFLKDIAYAICKEIFYAGTRNKKASVILPVSDAQTVLKVSNVVGLYQYARACEIEFRDIMKRTGYEVPKNLSEHNLTLYKLSIVLYHLSQQPTMTSMISLVYDLA